jgi:hypothetical protein
MGRTMKILTGLGVLAGISYFGKNRRAHDLAAREAGFLGYLRGLGQGFMQGVKSMLHLRKV